MTVNKLEGKVAVVTGGSKGIGAGIAKALAAAGASVVENYSASKVAAEGVVVSITASGGDAVAVRGDVSKTADVQALIDAAIKSYGRLDIVVNNSGIYEFAALEEITQEAFHKSFDINVLGPLLVIKAAAKYLGEGASVINIGSTAPLLRSETTTVYTATKAALDPITGVLASYGGVVITQAGTDSKVKGLVYISAFAPDLGESALSLMKSSPAESPAGSQIVADKVGFTKISQKGIDEDFAEELSPLEKAILFATQVPTSAPNALAVPVTEAAWKTKPSWTLITTKDRVIPVELQKAMAQKIGAQMTTIPASHLALLAHPQDVSSLIEQAVRGTEQAK